MPAWWPRKSKSKPKPEAAASCSSSPRKKPDPADDDDDEGPSPTRNPKSKLKRSNKKEKANSFDEALARKTTTRDLSPVNGGGGGSGPLFTFGHPLPRPVSSPLPSIPHELAAGPGSGSASASASSVSSSGSDETPDLGVYRYSDPISMPRGRNLAPDSQRQHHVAEDKHQCIPNAVFEHPRCSDISISPKKVFNLFNLDAPTHHQALADNIFNVANCSRGHPLPTSPVHPMAIRICPGSPKLGQDDLKSPPQPLPLPPGSPGSSSSSRSFPSQWKRGKLLGRGTFGHVYLGFNSESGQMFAIKEVKVISDDRNSKECLRQLNQEISLLSQLSHPNIVQYYGSELVDDTLSVYLEYVSGGSIHKLLQEYGPFREPVIRNYARQILSGLAYLHGRNTVHRDVKGANILVDPNGEVKLADFGMAKHISAYTSTKPEARTWSLEGSLKLKNPFGYADIWDLSGSYGWGQTTEVSAGLYLPRFKAFPSPLSARVSLLSQDWLNFSSYQERLFGVSLGLISSRNHDLSYNLTWRHLTDPTRMASKSIRRHLGHSLLSSVRYTFTLDRRNSQMRPTKGYAFRSTTQVSGLGPDSKGLRFIRQDFDLRAAAPLGILNAALNVGVAAGAIMPWGGGFRRLPSPLPDRFHIGGNSSPICALGGPTSLLGFRTRGVGPTDLRRLVPSRSENADSQADPGRDVLGGDVAVTAFADLSFDLPLDVLKKAGIHGHVFATVGNLAKITEDDFLHFSPRKFWDTRRSSGGLGLVVPTKFFRMEINYCFILKHLEHDRAKTGIQFSFSPSS